MSSFNFKEMIKGYSWQSHDYVEAISEKNSKNIIAGKCEIQGLRDEQQDVLVVNTVDVQAIKKLSKKSRYYAERKTVESLQKRYGQSHTMGSTLCVATGWMEKSHSHYQLHVSCTNVGDSTAFVVIVNRDTAKCRLSKLIHPLHTPENELSRLKKWGIPPKVFPGASGLRLQTGLAVSRAMGDRDSEWAGLIHTPNHISFQRSVRHHEQAFLIVACDGLTEFNVLNEVSIGEIVAESSKLSPEKIAVRLVDEAYQRGSQDNISVAVTILNERPISLAVFDGHGGHRVAVNLARHFYPVLKHHLITEI